MQQIAEHSKEYFDHLNSAVNGLCAVNQFNQQEINHLKLSLKSLKREYDTLVEALYEQDCLKRISGKETNIFDVKWKAKIGSQEVVLSGVNVGLLEGK